MRYILDKFTPEMAADMLAEIHRHRAEIDRIMVAAEQRGPVAPKSMEYRRRYVWAYKQLPDEAKDWAPHEKAYWLKRKAAEAPDRQSPWRPKSPWIRESTRKRLAAAQATSPAKFSNK